MQDNWPSLTLKNLHNFPDVTLIYEDDCYKQTNSDFCSKPYIRPQALRTDFLVKHKDEIDREDAKG